MITSSLMPIRSKYNRMKKVSRNSLLTVKGLVECFGAFLRVKVGIWADHAFEAEIDHIRGA